MKLSKLLPFTPSREERNTSRLDSEIDMAIALSVLRTLPPHQRQGLRDYYYSELSAEQAAETAHMGVAAFRQLTIDLRTKVNRAVARSRGIRSNARHNGFRDLFKPASDKGP